MDLQALSSSPIGDLVPIAGSDVRWGDFKYFAFVPHALPAEVALAPSTIAVATDAAIALGRLDAASDKLPNPRILIRPTLSKEAVSTSALEGTFAPLADVLESELVDRHSLSGSTREVLNYIAAAGEALRLLESRPVSLNMIAPLQSILVEATRGDAFDAGQLRQRQVMIGSRTERIEEARFIPPPHDRLPDAIAAWERWIHDERNALLVRIALGHYQFETLHPFSDGNGRLGRLIVLLQMIEGGALRYPLLNISEWLEPRREEYQQKLLELSVTGDFDAWIAFFCTGIREQSERALERITRLLVVRESFVELVKSVPGSRGGTALRIAEDLIGYPVFDIPWVAKWHGVRYQSADEAVKRLVGLGIVEKLHRPGGRTRKLFFAPTVLRELEA